jgi:hypothetical protein
MNPQQLDEILKSIATNAKGLREAGISGRVVVFGIEFNLTEPEPSLPVQPPTNSDVDPLDDPDTFGGEMPIRRTPRAAEQEE